MIGNLVGSYKILEKIGEGGMGAVFRGVDTMLEREVAVKALRPELARQPDIVERFRTEAVTLAKLNHPNIATLYSFLRQGDDFFMVMEFVRGETLDNRIKRAGAMRTELALPLFCQALEGIDHAHRLGIVHRDVKPANMMLTETASIKVMDFGIARVLGSARMTKQGNVVGTIEYMSPEQVRGLETDARSDIYSLGILLYEMLTGRVPFTSTSEYDLMKSQIEDAPPAPRGFVADIPANVEEALMRALAKEAGARFQSAAEFRGVLVVNAASEAQAYIATGRVASVGQPITAGPGPGETRVAAAPGPSQNQIKETRLPAGGYGQSYGQSQARSLAPAARASLLSRLNWKHYTGAAAVLALLIGVPFVLLLVLKGPAAPAAPQTAPATPPVQSGAAGANQSLPPASPGNQSLPAPQQSPAANRLDTPTVIEQTRPPAREPGGSTKPARSSRKEADDAAAKERERRRQAAERALDKP